MTIEESRAQFEAAMVKECDPAFLARYSEREVLLEVVGRYKFSHIEHKWQGWELHRRTVSEEGKP
jgi:hypothetical protein